MNSNQAGETSKEFPRVRGSYRNTGLSGNPAGYGARAPTVKGGHQQCIGSNSHAPSHGTNVAYFM